EPRGLFYRAATELIRLSAQGQTKLTLAEALAVLLQTWNRNAYRFGQRKFDTRHFEEIEGLLRRYRKPLAYYRRERIERISARARNQVVAMFKEFEVVLGPVGAAKALHLMAPQLFPLWDVAIAKGYGVPLRRVGANGDRYWRFMELAQRQC